MLGRTRPFRSELSALPFRAGTLATLAAAALLLGAAARFAGLDRLPVPLWGDDLTLITTALDLTGGLRDFADPVRPAPFGVVHPYGSVGVLYLEAYRLALLLFGTNAFGIRFLSAAAGVLSIGTAMLLGRALLPRGGGMLAGLAVAGLRWHLILSRWGWNAMAMPALLDIAALLLLAAGRRRRAAAAAAISAAAGLVAGLSAHVYLAAWVGGLAALTLFSLWPDGRLASRRLAGALFFAIGFLLAASPLLFSRGRGGLSYFQRVGQHNVVTEMRRQRSLLPPVAAAADALASPWFLPDPSPWNDLPGRSRLGWLPGIFVAVALARALWRPREKLSGFLLAHAFAAFAAFVAWGTEMQPNGFRFAYLTTVTGVAAAAGAMALLSLARPRERRAAAIAAVGLLAICGALAARDLFLKWGPSLEVSEGYQGRDNLLARAALRWRRYGAVTLDPRLETILTDRSPYRLETLIRYRLGAGDDADRDAVSARRCFRVTLRRAAGERAVERVRDGSGREWAVVIGSRCAERDADQLPVRQ